MKADRKMLWIVFLGSFLVLSVALLALTLFYRRYSTFQSSTMLPVSMRSELEADYGVDPFIGRIPALQMDIIDEIGRDQGLVINTVPSQIATMVTDLPTLPLPTLPLPTTALPILTSLPLPLPTTVLPVPTSLPLPLPTTALPIPHP